MTRGWSPIRRRSPSQVGTTCTPKHKKAAIPSTVHFHKPRPCIGQFAAPYVAGVGFVGVVQTTPVKDGIGGQCGNIGRCHFVWA